MRNLESNKPISESNLYTNHLKHIEMHNGHKNNGMCCAMQVTIIISVIIINSHMKFH